ncbi:MAG: hypothetical protein CFE26_20475 [Verrucomicrobiales bacterium VVV1]|nr:MAG: hypothetical protein CFE26_20475 [Verrucomicrobiales bacterium VVV1]
MNLSNLPHQTATAANLVYEQHGKGLQARSWQTFLIFGLAIFEGMSFIRPLLGANIMITHEVDA